MDLIGLWNFIRALFESKLNKIIKNLNKLGIIFEF